MNETMLADRKDLTPFDPWRGFENPTLSQEWHERLAEMARIARGNILKMTTLAASGHPGGSMSSIEIYLMLYQMSRISPAEPYRDDRDRIIISHGHTSPGAYSALGAAGYFDVAQAIHGFRQAGSPFEGHVEQSVPGIEWDTGNLGQGLSVGIGKALYSRLSGKSFHTFVFMGDGEQQKGQISESRRIAAKFKLNRLSAIIDYNRLQISGKIDTIMPQNIVGEWEADGWKVLPIDGHNLHKIYEALREAYHNEDAPIMILARTIMGKGVSFMENDESYHGAPIKADQLSAALEELGGIENDLDRLAEKRRERCPSPYPVRPERFPKVNLGESLVYPPEKLMDNRSAFGNALLSVADANLDSDDCPLAVFDCDLAVSVKTLAFAGKYPDNFFQFGISEHSTATASGSLSAESAVSVWADFGVFAIAETYNQARLNDINHTNLKLFCTHCGVNVGEDGKTHQCIDYFSLLNSTFGWKVITPADPNQTDKVVRYVLSHPGNFAVIMGRAKTPIITDKNGQPFFGKNYGYNYGRMDKVREGSKVVLAAAGNMMGAAFKAWEILKENGLEISLVSISDWSDLHEDDLSMLASPDHLVILEDHNVKNGLGAAVSAALYGRTELPGLTLLGVGDYASSGSADDLYRQLGLDSESVAKKIEVLAT